MTTAQDPTDILQEALGSADGFVELRYHKKRTRSVAVEKGRVDQAKIGEHTGVGVRVLVDGAMGFASTDVLEVAAVRRALDRARVAAKAASSARKEKLLPPPSTELAQGRFDAPGYEELAGRPIEAGLDLVLELEKEATAASSKISSAACGYTEIFEEKGIVTN
ncbi:MAG: TldD protein, partial [Planctomycetota bacterium]